MKTAPALSIVSAALTDAEALIAAAPFAALRADLRASLLERDDEVDGICTALIAGEHVLLLGPPGTAKSALANAISRALSGSRYFERLMGRFTVPEELFGPTSIAGLRADRFERVIDGFLPTADVAFLDEIFKANSAILNSLLTLINERKFDYGTARISVPLKLLIGASNELPEQDEALEALYDRFCVRFWVRPTTARASKRALLRMRGEPGATVAITAADVERARAAADQVVVPPEVEDAIIDCAEALARDVGVYVSDRRLRKIGKLVRARALLAGRATATLDDVMVLVDSAWTKPDERPAVLGVVTRTVAPALADALKLLDAATEARAQVDTKNRLDSTAIGKAAGVKKQIDEMATKARQLVPAGSSGAEKIEDVAKRIDALGTEIVAAISEAFRK